MAVPACFYAATCALALLAGPALAQQRVGLPVPADTLRRQQLGDVVVTATRTEKSLADVAIPVAVVGAKQIKSMGSLRLGDVLGEQTGLALVNDHGQGIQLQGLSPEYTLILVDGEPLIGRTAGTLDLTRVAVGNIQRVEVVKGPASALWGSDALASRQTDFNLNPTLTHRFGGERFFATLRGTYSRYHTQEDYTYAADGRYFDATYFTQTFLRPEAQLDYHPRPNQTLTLGGGYQRQTVEATRYEQRQTLANGYGYAQYDYAPTPRLSLVGGLRYDGPSVYAGQLSPKLAARYQLRPWLALRGSVGRGYRAPDFRQLYLNFSNPTVGYSVFGTSQVQAKVAQLAQQGQLALDPGTGQPIIYQVALAQSGSLTTESSVATNVGFVLEPKLAREDLTYRLTVNTFRNDLNNLIETTAVALKKNGQSVFSYRNVARAYTQGLELDQALSLPHGFTLGAGYQYLVAKDKAVEEALAAGTVFRRDLATQQTERVRPTDYGGLFGRSRHSWNAKLFYENPAHGLTTSLRAIYRGRYGFADANANAILDTDGEYVPGYLLLHVAASKTLGRVLTAQAGIDNLTGYTNPAYISTLPGRLLYASLSVELARKPAAP